MVVRPGRIVCNKSNTTCVTCGAPEFLVGFVLLGSLFFCVMFCRLLFVILTFYFWPLHCLSTFDLDFRLAFDLRLLIGLWYRYTFSMRITYTYM